MAVENLTSVQSVDTDMNEHTLTVRFDDEKLTLEMIVAALNEAGYTVPDYTKVE